jgi:hypothetical protein
MWDIVWSGVVGPQLQGGTVANNLYCLRSRFIQMHGTAAFFKNIVYGTVALVGYEPSNLDRMAERKPNLWYCNYCSKFKGSHFTRELKSRVTCECQVASGTWTVEDETLEETKARVLAVLQPYWIWLHPTLTFGFQSLGRNLSYARTLPEPQSLLIIWTFERETLEETKSCLARQDLVPSNSQIQPSKAWLRYLMLDRLLAYYGICIDYW